MEGEVQPVDEETVGARAVEVSAPQDEIEILSHRMSRPVWSGLVISVLFVVGGALND